MRKTAEIRARVEGTKNRRRMGRERIGVGRVDAPSKVPGHSKERAF